MAGTTERSESLGLRVTLDRLLYQRLDPAQSNGRPHAFVYFLSIHNDGPGPVTIRGRKWVVTHGDGSTLIVEGDGVVGQMPTITPGGKFSYNSYHTIQTRNAKAEGSFIGEDVHGRAVIARIPAFQLEVPETE